MVELPNGVHRVVARGREYFYWHPGRGTKHPGARVRLPSDPQSPEFWTALRSAQGMSSEVATFGSVIDLYLTSPKFLGLAKASQRAYRGQLSIARAGFGNLSVEAMRPSLIRGVVDGLADKAPTANLFLGVMKALSAWAVARDHLPRSITEGIEAYETDDGHKPWTDAQIAAAREHLTGAVRRGIMLALYTGQRGSDIVRLGWTDIDDNGFRLRQRKTGREVWCPILPELAAEMETWEKAPGTFVKQPNGKPYDRDTFAHRFAVARDGIPDLKGATIHGLRSTAVIRLRRGGLATAQIQDIIGMSMRMIERYSRFADKKASGQAAIIKLKGSA